MNTVHHSRDPSTGWRRRRPQPVLGSLLLKRVHPRFSQWHADLIMLTDQSQPGEGFIQSETLRVVVQTGTTGGNVIAGDLKPSSTRVYGRTKPPLSGILSVFLQLVLCHPCSCCAWGVRHSGVLALLLAAWSLGVSEPSSLEHILSLKIGLHIKLRRLGFKFIFLAAVVF